MTENYEPPQPLAQPTPPPPPPPAYPAQPAYPAPAGYGAPTAYGAPPAYGPIGTVRSTGTSIQLYIVTLGIYGWFWYYGTHDEMKRHSGTGLGGGVALILAIFVGIAMPFITSSEVGGLYERRGQVKPVSGVTGLWVFLPFVGGIVWFVKTNGALNDYWRSLGAQG